MQHRAHDHDQEDKERARYRKQTLRQLSKEPTREFSKGFSLSNIQFMRRFYQTIGFNRRCLFPIAQVEAVLRDWHETEGRPSRRRGMAEAEGRASP